MALLTKDAILAAEDLKFEEMHVPEWGGDVRLRTLTAKERDAFETGMVKINKKGQREDNLANLRARLVSLCMVDEKGYRIFTSATDVEALGNKSIAALGRVFEKCQEMNAMTDEDVEELAEGFDQAPDESSSSD
ncbi:MULTISPECIES: hypothetical protein [Nocardia]|uniref:hypothetical protein n=1 Tax=Nocardia TaxID=1817 RepID=UPI0007A4D7D0|nr:MULTISPECIES: hypothetical protein [Nocardia]